jgi:hypothetical protein
VFPFSFFLSLSLIHAPARIFQDRPSPLSLYSVFSRTLLAMPSWTSLPAEDRQLPPGHCAILDAPINLVFFFFGLFFVVVILSCSVSLIITPEMPVYFCFYFSVHYVLCFHLTQTGVLVLKLYYIFSIFIIPLNSVSSLVFCRVFLH